MMLTLTLVLVLWFMVRSPIQASGFQIAKPGCPDRCGDVTIPYPFGIGDGCYRDHGDTWSLECNSSSGNVYPLRPNFPGGSVVISNISLEGQFRVWNNIGYDCNEDNQEPDNVMAWLMLGGIYNVNSTANKFTAIGCDTISLIQGLVQQDAVKTSRQYTTGCVSMCNVKDDVGDGPACSGIGCCQTSIPTGAWQINVSLTSFYNHSLVSKFNPCSYAFVVENDAFHFSADNLTNIDKHGTLPVLVDWVIDYQTCDEAKKNASTYACVGANSGCLDEKGALGYRCRCNDGYEGNPYLSTGCKDINECSNSSQCPKHSTCAERPGSFTCKCNSGYHAVHENGVLTTCVKRRNWPIFVGVALSVGAVVLLPLSFWLYSECMRRKEKMSREELFRKNGGFVLQQKLSTGGSQGGGAYSARLFTYQELKKATNDFDETQIIGRGGFGTVFKGELMDKRIVAIKKSREVDEHQVDQFINEVMLLSQINSRNVVKLLGCCLETEVPLLVYEFIDNGTLYENLHDKIKALRLSWNIRLRIASEVAGVLSYLHSVASYPIIHRDIKSANILLDHNYTAKVSDFGISRLVPSDDDQVATMVQGTLGYLDPEYMQTGLLTEKSDVYSFGIVLIELITGKKVLASDKPEAEKFLSNGFLSCLKENHLTQVLDSNIICYESMEQLQEVAMIAKRCISVRGDDRPCMKDVERELAVLGAKAKQISVEVFEIDSSKSSEAFLGMQSSGYDSSTSSGLYSSTYATTEQPLIKEPQGR